MALPERVRAFWAPVLLDVWIYPILILLLTAMPGIFGVYSGDDWIRHVGHTFAAMSALVLCCGLPIHLSYEHIWPRLFPQGSNPLAPRALGYHLV